MNNFKTPNIKQDGAIGKKSKNLERQIQKGFQISKAEGGADIFAMAAMKLQKTLSQSSRQSSFGSKRASVRHSVKLTGKQKFKGLALKAIKQEHGEEEEAEFSVRNDPIGSTATSIRRRNRSLRRSLIKRGNSIEDADKLCLSELNSDELVTYNPKLASFTPTTRIAYAKFKNIIKSKPPFIEDEEDGLSPRKSTLKVESEKPNGQVVVLPKSPKLEAEKSVRSARPSPERLSEAKYSAGPSPVKSEVEKVSEASKPPPKNLDLEASKSPDPPKTPKKSPQKSLSAPKTAEQPKSPVKSPAKTLKPPDTPPDSPVKSPEPSKSPAKSPEPPKTPAKSVESPKTPSKSPEPPATPKKSLDIPKSPPEKSPSKSVEASGSKSPMKSPEIKVENSGSKSPKRPVKEVAPDEDTRFDPKGKSVSTGKTTTGWL